MVPLVLHSSISRLRRVRNQQIACHYLASILNLAGNKILWLGKMMMRLQLHPVSFAIFFIDWELI